jgi:hypothetical protein
MTWEVVGTDEFEAWFLGLDEADRALIIDRVDLLEQVGPSLGRPVVDAIKGSVHHNMKELRASTLRVLFVFDPTSSAVLLLGGDKQDNWKGWSREAIPRADVLYDEYLEATKDEGNKK